MKKYMITACSFWIVILLASTLSASRIDEYLTDSMYATPQDISWSDIEQEAALNPADTIRTHLSTSVQGSSSDKKSSPEPITMLLFGTCLTALATLERRRNKE